MASKTYAAFFALFSLAISPVHADQLFVLHDDASTATVLDPQTLDSLGSAPAPSGVFRVFGLPEDAAAGRRAKFYLVGERAIVVVNENYQETHRVELPAPAIRAPHGAALSADGSRLLVATRFGVVAVRTSDDAIVARMIPGFPIGGVALLPDPDRAWVFAAGAATARSIEIGEDRLSEDVTYLAAPLSAASLSSLGTHALGLADRGVYDLTQIETARFRGGAQPTAVSGRAGDAAARLAVLGSGSKSPAPSDSGERLVVTDSGRFFMARDGRLLRGSPLDSRLAASIADPASGSVLDPRTTPWAAAADGSRLFTVERGASRLWSFDPDDLSSSRSIDLAAEPTGVEVVVPRVRQAGSLQLVTLNNTKAAGGTTFHIQVSATDGAGAPQRDLPVFVSNIFPDTPPLSCISGLTNTLGEATIECSLGPVTTQTTIQITISDAAGRTAPIFSLVAVPPTAAEGLAKIEGDGERFPADSTFSLRVQLSRNRLPVEGSILRVTTDPVDPDIFTCLLQTETDENGEADIECTSKELAGSEQVSVTVTEFATGDSVTFAVTIDPTAREATRIRKVAGDDQTVIQGSQFIVTVQVTDLAGFSPILNINIVTPSDPPVATCPTNWALDEDGFASIPCQARSILGNNIQVKIQVSHFGTTLPEPFTITIVRSGGGFGGAVSTLELLTPEDFPVVPGVPAVNAIQVKAVRDDGQPVPEINIYFSSPGDVVFDPPVAETDAGGIAQTTVTAGCNPGGDPPIFVGFEPGDQFIDLKADIQPGTFSQLVKLQGDNQSGAPGQQLNQQALVALGQDQCGNIVPMQEVSWRVVPAYRGSLRNVINITDDRGRTSALATLGQLGGPFEVEVAAGEAKTRFTLAVNLPAEDLVIRSGDAQNALAGQALAQPLVVQALGITGFGVGGVPVQWQATGPAQIVGSSSQTDAAGVSFARVRLGAAANPQQGTGPQAQVTATAMGKTVTFFINGSPKPIAPVEAFVNGASFLGGWTPGSAGSIFGQLLAPQLTVADRTPFPTVLGGVSVTVNNQPAPLIFVAPGQVNLQVPFETQPGPATVVINNNGQSTTVPNVPVNAVQPGIFIDPNTGRAAALRQDFSVITAANPAVPGEVVQLFFTGGGPLDSAVQTNQPGPSSPLAFTTNGVVVGVDGEGQQTLAAVYAPGLVTAYQVNFVLGENTASGDRDLSIVVNGVGSQTVKLPVQ